MAMFPLGSVLFPFADLPLHVFEERYRLMTRRVMQGDREFGVVLIERGHEVGGGDVRFDVATVARVVHATELPDGRFGLTTVGTRRIRVVQWLRDDPYPQADVEPFDDPPAGRRDAERRDRVAVALAEFVGLARRIDPRLGEIPPLAADPLRASYEAAAMAPIGPLDAQRVLSAPDVGTRFDLLASLIDDATAVLRSRLELED